MPLSPVPVSRVDPHPLSGPCLPEPEPVRTSASVVPIRARCPPARSRSRTGGSSPISWRSIPPPRGVGVRVRAVLPAPWRLRQSHCGRSVPAARSGSCPPQPERTQRRRRRHGAGHRVLGSFSVSGPALWEGPGARVFVGALRLGWGYRRPKGTLDIRGRSVSDGPR